MERLLSVAESAHRLGIGKTRFFELLKAEELHAVSAWRPHVDSYCRARALRGAAPVANAKPQPPRRVCARAAWGTAMIKICLVTTTDSLDVLIPGEPARRSGMMPPTSASHRHVAAGHAASPPWATAERCGVRAMNAAEIACTLGDARRPGRVWRCLCPLHGGHSLLRATAVKFNLTMAPTTWLPKLLSSPA